MINSRNLPPTDCDECKRGWHPSIVYKCKDGKKICRRCLLKLSLKFTMEEIIKQKNLNGIDGREHLKKILLDDEFLRYSRNVSKK